MKIKSERSSIGIIRIITSYIYTWIGIVFYSYVLAMSYGKLPPEPFHVMIGGLIQMTFANIYYFFISKEILQEYEDNAFTTALTRNMMLGPISMFLSLWCLWVLITGNMIGWGWYLITAIGITTIAAIHKKQKGVVKKSDD